jgi:phosphoenolpyruvate carboxykinase (ATP)
MATIVSGREGLGEDGLEPTGEVVLNPTTSQLYTAALARGDGRLAEGGPLVVDTGRFTGRSPKDKLVVDEPGSRDRIWWGSVNAPLAEDRFHGLREKVVGYLAARPTLYVVDAFAGADPAHRIGVRVITESPYHALFAKTMFIEPTAEELASLEPRAVVLHAPEVEADPEADGTRTGTFVVLHPSRGEVLIGGTFYAGEIKKSIFTLLNDRLPLEGVLPMHCSANVGPDGDVAIFFGLSGTGKTTLSADPARSLIGDDEHGWGASGVFNLEGGCYAKVIRLSREAEPEIHRTTRTFGTVLENVAMDERGVLDLDDDGRTENTRAAYALEQIANALPARRAGHPRSVVMLTADAFGILPPLARLTRDQALFYFLSGFTAKLAGTEIGVEEPQPTFSACFGAPFLPQPPAVYARMLGEKLDEHGSTVWLVNTGWTGGPFGEGARMPIAATRTLLDAALSGALDEVPYRTDPVFGFAVPTACPGVEGSVLDPRATWRDRAAYDAKARELAGMFRANFEQFRADAGDAVAAAAPHRGD